MSSEIYPARNPMRRPNSSNTTNGKSIKNVVTGNEIKVFNSKATQTISTGRHNVTIKSK